MIRLGAGNTRYKDVFDICYLSKSVDVKQLKDCIDKYIFADNTLHNVTTMNDIVRRIEKLFSNPRYLNELQISDKNWLGISTDDVLKKDLDFIKSIKD